MTMLSMMKLLKKKNKLAGRYWQRFSQNDYDAVLDNLRAEEKSISLITDFTINNPDIQDYCKHLILYNLTVHDYKDISFGEWIVNLKGLSGLAYIPVSFTKNGISDKTNYSCECKKNSDNRIDICECDISDMSHIIKKPFFTETYRYIGKSR